MKSIQNKSLNSPYTIQNDTLNTILLHHKKAIESPNIQKPSFPLFSYSLSADLIDIDIIKILKLIKTDSKHQFKASKQKQKSYLSNLLIKSKDGFKQINYDDMVKRSINEDINYKNSFIKYSYDCIDNCSPVFITLTLDAHYHLNVSGKRNPIFNGLTEDETKETLKRLHYDGYNLIKKFSRTLFANKIFKTGKLDKLNRSYISALEPHKDWTPHEHQLHFINGYYILDFVENVVRTVSKLQLGRTQIVVTKKDLEQIEQNHKLTIKYAKGPKNKVSKEYHLEGSNVYFQEFIIAGNDELKSISNYLSSYMETKHYSFEDTQDSNHKKQVIEYEGFAHYISGLKDIFQPKREYGKTHRKIRRMNYSQQLISRSVYKRIMTSTFIDYLKSINEYQETNMYYHVTNMLKSGHLTVFKYIETFATGENYNEAQDVYYEYLKYEKHNVNYYNIAYKDYSELIDCKSYDVYSVDLQTMISTLLHESKQIDLSKDNFVVIEYKLKRNGNNLVKELF